MLQAPSRAAKASSPWLAARALAPGHRLELHHHALLNYGDAVAHLNIARRVFDSRIPRFSELGSVWLPLPHSS